MPSSRRQAFIHGIVASAVLSAGCSGSDWVAPGAWADIRSGDVLLAAAGDIACGTETKPTFACAHGATAALIRAIKPQGVLALGDLQYEDGELEDFRRFYHPTWGVFKGHTYATPGNHEYDTPGAAGYFDYFNGVGVDSGPAGHRLRGYYAVTRGGWQLISLNSNCAQIGGCHPGSPQERWLRALLANSTARCTLAFWHHARFTSVGFNDTTVAPLWKALEEHGADLVLASHGHNYERFAPLTAAGVPDAVRGIRSFVVGTGGKSVYNATRTEIGSEVKAKVMGVLRLVLRDGRFDWFFRAVPGSAFPRSHFSDSGSAACH